MAYLLHIIIEDVYVVFTIHSSEGKHYHSLSEFGLATQPKIKMIAITLSAGKDYLMGGNILKGSMSELVWPFFGHLRKI